MSHPPLDLILDTAGKGVLLGLFGEKIQHICHEPVARGEQIQFLLNESLETISAPLHSIQRVLVVNGPGSFTGLRTGLAFAQGLCFSGNRTLHGITSLANWYLQYQSQSSYQPLGVLLYARPGFWYVGWGDCLGNAMSHESFVAESKIPELFPSLSEGGIIISDRPCPVEGPLTIYQSNWIQPTYPAALEGARFALAQIPAVQYLGANYLQASYADR